MTATQVKVAPRMRAAWRIPLRILFILGIAFLIGAATRQISLALERTAKPAGFGRGVLQGALMPCALPALASGHDVAIYASNNSGLSYKLGYTVGVNACGAVFFGYFFWRVNRWRKGVNGRKA